MKKLILIALLSLGISGTASAFSEVEVAYCSLIGTIASATSTYVQRGYTKSKLVSDLMSADVDLDDTMCLVIDGIYKIPVSLQDPEQAKAVYNTGCLEDGWSPTK